MTHLFFQLIAALSVAFFVWRMRVDPLAVAAGACVIYFTPGFWGTAQFFRGVEMASYSETIVPAAYVAMALPLIALTASALVVDRVPVARKIDIGLDRQILIVLILFTAMTGTLSIRNTNMYFLCLDKRITLSKIDLWYHYATLSIPFVVAIAYRIRWWPALLIGLICILADLFAGFRLSAATAFLACVMLTEDWIRRGWRVAAKLAAIVVVGGAALFLAKPLIEAVKRVTASYCDNQLAVDAKSAVEKRSNEPLKPQTLPSQTHPADKLVPLNLAIKTDALAVPPRAAAGEILSAAAADLTRSKFYFAAFVERSEPFVIQSILNEVARMDFRTGAAYLVDQILAGVPLGASLLGIDSTKVVSFNNLMQPVLFPELQFSVANNPWAQAYAAGGQWMVGAFALGYALVAGFMTLLFRSTDGALRAGVAVISGFTGFYFHRNDLLVEVVLLKHVVYIFGIAVAVAWIWNRVSPSDVRASTVPDL